MKRFPLALQLALALVLGVLAGLALGPRAAPLKHVTTLVVDLLKTLAGPLVFFAILDAFARTEIEARKGAKLLGISFMNACVAGGIALAVSNLLPFGRRVPQGVFASQPPHPSSPPLRGGEGMSLIETLFPEPPNTLGIVLLALLLGLALRRLPQEDRAPLAAFSSAAFKLLATTLGWIVKIVPLAAFCVLAQVTGTSGLKVLETLASFVFLVTLAITLHVVVYYALLLYALGGIPPWKFFPAGLEALLTAFTTGSSLATLPVTLRTLDDMKVSPESARLAACVGTNLNHDGILLYEAVAALFVAQALGQDLTLAQQGLAVVTSALAAVGIAGIPDAGFITLTLVLGSVGLPASAAPVLLPVDWFLGRLRASANVASDLTVANLLDAQSLGGQGSRS
ncbi:MAG TPA: dicarboxylate/amino acid:cation symporter [Planctomycetota bacterium]|nr:dicarboxylate/amino acid:cation symporter [Planctomycetota bacterium]